MLLLGAVAFLGGCIRTGPHSTLHPAGPQALHIDRLWWLLLAICIAVFIAVMIAVVAAMTRRHPASDKQDLPPDTLQRTVRVVGGAVGLTAIILLVLVTASAMTDRRLAVIESGEDPLAITIVGRRWWWEARYEDVVSGNRIVTANEIHIPVGRPVHLKLESADVIHSFWVPALHGKMDLVPGRVNHLWLQADRAGVYEGQCAEFCGAQHAHMRLLVVAQPPEEFDAWRAAQRQPAREPVTPQERRGRDVFLASTCVMCHTIRGTTAGSRAGPELTHLASRRTLGAAIMPNTCGYLAGWILDPQGIKPGNHMPPHSFAPDDLHALLDYLTSLE